MNGRTYCKCPSGFNEINYVLRGGQNPLTNQLNPNPSAADSQNLKQSRLGSKTSWVWFEVVLPVRVMHPGCEWLDLM